MMGRRGFLKFLGAGVVGLSLALRVPEKAQKLGMAIRFAVNWEPLQFGESTRFDVYLQPAVDALADEWDRRALMFVDSEVLRIEPGRGLVRGG